MCRMRSAWHVYRIIIRDRGATGHREALRLTHVGTKCDQHELKDALQGDGGCLVNIAHH